MLISALKREAFTYGGRGESYIWCPRRGAAVRGTKERFCFACCADKTRLYRLHRHIEFKYSGMRICVVQSVVVDVSKESLCLHFESQIVQEESPVRKIGALYRYSQKLAFRGSRSISSKTLKISIVE